MANAHQASVLPIKRDVIQLDEAESTLLRDLTRRLSDAQQDAQLAADRAKVTIFGIVLERERLVRQLSDRYGFDATIAHEHDSSAHTLARQKKG